MGYSSPKKPFDLKDFLTRPGKAVKRPTLWRRGGTDQNQKNGDAKAAAATTSPAGKIEP